MKQYDRFGEYMFDLLFAPLKKGKRAVNQFYIFFKVIGRVFDGLKEDALRVRDETNIATASPIMLPAHGQDRNMPRLAGEDIEAYRTRLAMKGVISEWGGTKRGILYVLAALGYERSSITPVYQQDPERWAEFIVDLGVGNTNAVKNFYAIFSEIQRVKEGSSKVAGIVFTMQPICAILHVGGSPGAIACLGVPQGADEYDFRGTLHMGGTSGIQASAGVHEAGDDLSCWDRIFPGGKFSAQEKMPIPKSADPPSTTILRTGGVCTIISNSSIGE